MVESNLLIPVRGVYQSVHQNPEKLVNIVKMERLASEANIWYRDKSSILLHIAAQEKTSYNPRRLPLYSHPVPLELPSCLLPQIKKRPVNDRPSFQMNYRT
jgi:hypothetical protein